MKNGIYGLKVYKLYENSWDAIKGEYNKDFWLYFDRNVINHKTSDSSDYVMNN